MAAAASKKDEKKGGGKPSGGAGGGLDAKQLIKQQGSVKHAFRAAVRKLTPSAEQNDPVVQLRDEIVGYVAARFSGYIEQIFLGGSYARRTADVPVHDIDVFVVFRRDWCPDRNQMRIVIAKYLRKAGFNKKAGFSTRARKRAVSVTHDNSGNQVDIVPIHERAQHHGYRIWNSEQKVWEPTDPHAFTKLAIGLDKYFPGRARVGRSIGRSLIRVIKYWNRNFNRKLLKSMHVEVLVLLGLHEAWGAALKAKEHLSRQPVEWFAIALRYVIDHCCDPTVAAPGGDPTRAIARYLLKPAGRLERLLKNIEIGTNTPPLQLPQLYLTLLVLLFSAIYSRQQATYRRAD